jgi:hypothetical protein
MFLSRVVPLAFVLGTIGCMHVDVLRLDETIRPQTQPDSVRLIAQEPKQPYTVIALVSVMPDAQGGGSQDGARKRLLKEAARLGGDAVLMGTGSLTRVGTGGEYGGTALLLTGKVIVFDREAARTN